MPSVLDSTNSLIALTDLKTFLDIAASDTDYDNRLEDVINAVSWFFNLETGRHLKAQDLTEYYDGRGGSKLFLNSYPINSTSSTIEVYESTDNPRVWDATTKLDGDYLVIEAVSGIVYYEDGIFEEHPQSIKAVYNGGYAYSGAEVPYDLQRAVLETGNKLWNSEIGKEIGKQSVSAGGSSVAFVESFLPDFAKLTIERYVRE